MCRLRHRSIFCKLLGGLQLLLYLFAELLPDLLVAFTFSPAQPFVRPRCFLELIIPRLHSVICRTPWWLLPFIRLNTFAVGDDFRFRFGGWLRGERERARRYGLRRNGLGCRSRRKSEGIAVLSAELAGT